jgi:hypothetical protein
MTKPQGSGGAVNRRTVVEQLTYEIGDPRQYLTPDVSVDFTTVTVDDLGSDRVQVSGAKGSTSPDTYKVSAAYDDGYMAAGELLVYGSDAAAKARKCAELVFDRLAAAGVHLARTHVEVLGAGEAAGVEQSASEDGARPVREVVLRMAVHDADRAKVERFTRELAPLITAGPAGLAGYAAGRPVVRPVFAYLPLLVERAEVRPQVEVKTAGEWAS